MRNIENIFLNIKKYLLKKHKTQFLLKHQKFRDLVILLVFDFQSDLFIKKNIKILFVLE
ncbi:hypothetical protein [Spiroplasma endosymbiont of Agriotes lineatus]|uniref:hypothetical protein n=1 Tax=Spiroplasma endosymbiont of Agriotes lineatus TaxID=3077930 RepID=UPI0030D3E24B